MANTGKVPDNLLEQIGDGAEKIMQTMQNFGVHLFDSSNQLNSKIVNGSGKLSAEAKEKLGDFADQAQDFISNLVQKLGSKKDTDDNAKETSQKTQNN